MKASGIDSALKMAAATAHVHASLPAEDLQLYHKKFNIRIFRVKIRKLMKKYTSVKPKDYFAYYIVYRELFPYMKWALYVTLLTEVALNPKQKNQRNKLEKMAKTQTKHAKTARGGFIIMGLAAIGAAIAGAASTAGAAVAATAATAGTARTAIASSTVPTVIVGDVVSAAASAGVGVIIDAV